MSERAGELMQNTAIRDAVRNAMKAGHRNEVLLITNIEDFAQKQVRAAFDALIETVACAAAPSAPAQTPEWLAEYRRRMAALNHATLVAAHKAEGVPKQEAARRAVDAWVLGTGKEGEE